jgi:putative hydroxymethylpyrimidine transport system substrate-binding protein
MRRWLLFPLTLAFLALITATAFGSGDGRVSLLLDWTRNPDHVGIYMALGDGSFTRAGLSVDVRAPSDPSAPLKLVAAGRTDLAVSYEQEVFFARAQGLPVVAVAAVVPRPLNSLIWITRQIHSLADLRGRRIGITGVPSDYAMLTALLARVGLGLRDVKVVSVGYNLLPALLAHRVDAAIGVYRNVEGVELTLRRQHPHIVPVDQAGIPSYDELVLVANSNRLAGNQSYAMEVRRFVAALEQGTTDARRHPHHALAELERVTTADHSYLAAATTLTLRLLDVPRGTTCINLTAWRRFGAWMYQSKLLKTAAAANQAMTSSYLPPQCRMHTQ